jgi:hypothetical protein
MVIVILMESSWLLVTGEVALVLVAAAAVPEVPPLRVSALPQPAATATTTVDSAETSGVRERGVDGMVFTRGHMSEGE